MHILVSCGARRCTPQVSSESCAQCCGASLQTAFCVCSRMLHGLGQRPKPRRWPLDRRFPTRLALWIWSGPNPGAPPAAPGVRSTHFWQPGPSQGGRAEPGGTDHPRVVVHYTHLDMAARCRRSSLSCLGPSVFKVRSTCAARPQLLRLSSRRRRSVSGGPLLWQNGPANAARLHLAPHGWPS